MGTVSRSKPKRLAEKLKAVRERLGFTYDELINRFGDLPIPLYQSSISRFESGLREPPLQILLKYARLANISTDILIDDEIDLPVNLPVGK